MRIALILSGCGNRDGSELQETISLMLAFDRRGWQYQCFSPEGQYRVVSHLNGQEMGERDILVESARIARGNIKTLNHYHANDYDALALPGGMGAARNLSTFAFDGIGMKVRPDVEQAINETYNARKPVLAMCIAPIVVAKVLGRHGITLTLGQPCVASQVAEQLGAKHQCCQPTEFCADRHHKIYSTPAYMVGNRISEIFAGAENMVAALEADLSKAQS